MLSYICLLWIGSLMNVPPLYYFMVAFGMAWKVFMAIVKLAEMVKSK